MVAFGVLLCGLIMACFAADLQARYRETIEAAKHEALNHAEILADNTVVTFETVSRILHETELIRQGVSSGTGTLESADIELRHLAQTSKLVVAIGWTDEAGDLVAHSYEQPPPRRNIADLPHFTAQRDGAGGPLFVSEPFRAASTENKWLIAVSRRLDDGNGNFSGVVAAVLDPVYFNQVYRSFNLGNGGAIVLLRRSGQVLVREPSIEKLIGKSFAGGPLLKDYLPQSEAGSYELASGTDGIARIVGYKAVVGSPLVVVVSYGRAAILAAWYRHLYQSALLLALIIGSILCGTVVLARQARYLATKSDAIATTNAYFDAALTNMSTGLSLFDANGNLVVWNDRFRTMDQLSPDQVRRGVNISTLVQYRRDAGNLDREVEEYVGEFRQQLVDRGRSSSISKRRDGRTIAVVNTATADGGWVGIHEDITDQVLREAEIFQQATDLAQINMRFDAALSNMTQGLCLFDADKRVVIANHRFREIYQFPPEMVLPGTPLTTLLRHYAQIGSRPDLALPGQDDLIRSQPEQFFRTADGRSILIKRSRTPDGGWVATHDDVTAQKRQEQLLQEKAAELALMNSRFDAALSHMAQGLCMFDGQKRLVVWNDRYAEFYQVPPHLLKVGTPYQAIIADRVARGVLKGQLSEEEAENKVAELTQLPPDAWRVDELADGRLVMLVRQPMADGGWLSIIEDITERKRAEAEIVYLARHDALTGLANRTNFNARLGESLKRLKRYGTAFNVLMLDLDKFKAVNDSWGHPAGDKLLVEVARRLQSLLRDTDVPARLGGDEFAIIQDIGSSDPREAAAALSRRIIAAIEQPFDLSGFQASVGTSIGIALAPVHGDEPDQLLTNADVALYHVKAAGRNDFRIFEPHLLDIAKLRKSAESELRDAIAEGQFEVHYQSVVDIRTRSLRAVEALLRWQHPTKGLLGPDQFIPLAEATGLIVPLGNWSLRQACRDAMLLPAHVKVAVNLSAVQISQGNVSAAVLSALTETGLAPQRLELEITEASLLVNTEAHLATIQKLKQIGIAIVLDDFGTGYSSLSYLTHFPIDMIKIDRSFTHGVLHRRDCAAVIAALLALARGLGSATTAEGIETEAQLDYMRNAGVDLAQGYLFSRPMPISQINPRSRDELVA